jgi:tetratricopeptide (TPR) repeat protein
MLDLAVAILAVAALIGVIAIVARRFPSLAAIDTSTIPAERHDELKTRLIEERLRRKAGRVLHALAARLKPIGRIVRTETQRRYRQLLELEQRYRTRATVGAHSPAERVKVAATVESLLTEASAALKAGNLNSAEQRVIEAIRISPRSVAAYRVLANVYREQKDYEHARETLTFVIERLHVEDDEVYAELGQAAAGEGNLEAAKHDLEKSISLNQTAAEHYLDLCRVNLMLGDSAAAFDCCRTAVELEPNSPKYLDSLVEASILSGKREWADETLAKLRAVNPENQKLSELAARIEAMPKSRSRRHS